MGSPKNRYLECVSLVEVALSGKLQSLTNARQIYVIKETPWENAVNFERKFPRKWTEIDLHHLRMWMEGHNPAKFATRDVEDAVRFFGRHNAVNMLEKNLTRTQWDGVKRLDTWLSDYLGAPRTQHVGLIGRKFLIAMVTRGLNPGCKFDCMLILEGEQGIGKSRICRILAGEDELYSDEIVNLRDTQEVIETWSGKLVVEVGDLSSFTRQDQRIMKGFLSKQVDRARLAYRRDSEEYPRTFVFIGTTNEVEYLEDATGGRRFWIVECGDELDVSGLAAVRNQLVAEAVQAYLEGEIIYLPRKVEVDLEEGRTRKLVIDDLRLFKGLANVFPTLQSACDEKGLIKLLTITNILEVEHINVNSKQFALALRRMGAKRVRHSDGAYWRLPDALPPEMVDLLEGLA